MSVLGVDRSHYQGTLTVAAAAECKRLGRDFVISKATEGPGNFGSGSDPRGLDVTYEASRLNAKTAGLVHGAYHLGRRTGTGAQQWAHFRAEAAPGTSELVALDVEAGWSIDQANAQGFVNAGRAAGFKVGVYGTHAEAITLSADWYWFAASTRREAGTIDQGGTVPILGTAYDSDTYYGPDIRALTTGGTVAAIDDVAAACGLTTAEFIESVKGGRALAMKGLKEHGPPAQPVSAEAYNYLTGLEGGAGPGTGLHTHFLPPTTGTNG